MPARASRDELAGAMLTLLLKRDEIQVETASAKFDADELVKLVENSAVDVVCISVVSPSTVLHARYLCLKLRAKLRSERIIVGLWGHDPADSDAIRRIQESGANEVVTTFKDAVTLIKAVRPATGEAVAPDERVMTGLA